MPRRKREPQEGTAAWFNAHMAPFRLSGTRACRDRWFLYDGPSHLVLRLDLPETLALLVAAGFVKGAGYAERRQSERALREEEQKALALLARVPTHGTA